MNFIGDFTTAQFRRIRKDKGRRRVPQRGVTRNIGQPAMIYGGLLGGVGAAGGVKSVNEIINQIQGDWTNPMPISAKRKRQIQILGAATGGLLGAGAGAILGGGSQIAHNALEPERKYGHRLLKKRRSRFSRSLLPVAEFRRTRRDKGSRRLKAARALALGGLGGGVLGAGLHGGLGTATMYQLYRASQGIPSPFALKASIDRDRLEALKAALLSTPRYAKTGAVAGSLIGAGYGLHRYEQKKNKKRDRRSRR